MCVVFTSCSEDDTRRWEKEQDLRKNAPIIELHHDFVKYANYGVVDEQRTQDRNYYYDIIDGHEYLIVVYGDSQYRYAGMTHSLKCSNPECKNK